MIAEALKHLARPIGDLTLDPDNARTHDQENLDAIKVSLERFGQRMPLVVQEQGMVVRSGNGRLLAMKELGWEEVAVLVVDESDAEAAAFAVADNRTAELSGWDEKALLSIIKDWEGSEQEAFGFKAADVDAMQNILDAAYSPETDPEIGGHTVSEEDIKKAKDKIEDFSRNDDKMIEVCCPNCSETFKVLP